MPTRVDKPIVAVDIDEVLAAQAESFVEFSNKRWNTNLKVEDYHEHWAELWQIDEAENERRSREVVAPGNFEKLRLIAGAKEALQKLAKDYKLIVVTSRRIVIEAETREWLDKNFPGLFYKVEFAGIWDRMAEDRMKMTKTEHLRRLKVDYFIDDQPRHCLPAAEAGITSLLFGDYKWNRGLKLPKNVVWVKNWQEVLDYFSEK
jgi:5'(3')-deoxyribonucleotidase